MKVKIFKIIKITAGGFHSWCESNVGRIRKPNHNIFLYRNWLQKLCDWIINFFKKWQRK